MEAAPGNNVRFVVRGIRLALDVRKSGAFGLHSQIYYFCDPEDAMSYCYNRRPMGKKAQLKYGKLFTVLCACNNSCDPTPARYRVRAADATCARCGRRPWLDLRQHATIGTPATP